MVTVTEMAEPVLCPVAFDFSPDGDPNAWLRIPVAASINIILFMVFLVLVILFNAVTERRREKLQDIAYLLYGGVHLHES